MSSGRVADTPVGADGAGQDRAARGDLAGTVWLAFLSTASAFWACSASRFRFQASSFAFLARFFSSSVERDGSDGAGDADAGGVGVAVVLVAVAGTGAGAGVSAGAAGAGGAAAVDAPSAGCEDGEGLAGDAEGADRWPKRDLRAGGGDAAGGRLSGAGRLSAPAPEAIGAAGQRELELDGPSSR